MQQKTRCPWCLSDPLYIKYHDEEWGREIHDDQRLFEFLILEGAQAGLSWLTVLKKRENYRKAFDNFDYEILAKKMSSRFLEHRGKIPASADKGSRSRQENELFASLMSNPGIIRNKLKILSVFNNAQEFIEVRKEFGSFDNYLWSFLGENRKQIVNDIKEMKDIQPRTELSDKISKDLKKRGFKFIGTTIIYAFMQAVGMVDDHWNNCWCKIAKDINSK